MSKGKILTRDERTSPDSRHRELSEIENSRKIDSRSLRRREHGTKLRKYLSQPIQNYNCKDCCFAANARGRSCRFSQTLGSSDRKLVDYRGTSETCIPERFAAWWTNDIARAGGTFGSARFAQWPLDGESRKRANSGTLEMDIFLPAPSRRGLSSRIRGCKDLYSFILTIVRVFCLRDAASLSWLLYTLRNAYPLFHSFMINNWDVRILA